MTENPETETAAKKPLDVANVSSILAEDYALNPTFVSSVVDALSLADSELVQRLVAPLHAADLADLLGLISPRDRTALLQALGSQLDPEALIELDEDVRDMVLKDLEPRDIARIVEKIDSDDAVQLIEDLPPEERASVLQHVSADDRTAVEHGLTHVEDSAGRLMQQEIVTVPPFWNVGQVIDHMRATDGLPDQFFEIYVVDESFHPTGCVPISRLMQAQRERPIRELMDADQHVISTDMDQGEVAYLFNQYHLLSSAVVNSDGRLVGMITIDDIVDVIKEEDTEDIHALGGVKDEGLSDGVFKTSQRRFSWLLVNLATAVLASIVIALFEDVIEQVVALAILMPIVASMGGNAGTQTLTVAVRAIATRDLTPSNAFRIIVREVLVGGVNGALFAILMGLIGGFWYQSTVLGLVLAIAMIINLICAGAAGILVPLGLQRSGADPALASTVFVTTVTDLIGFFVFLGLGGLLLI